MTSQDDKREPKVYWADFNRHPDSEDDFFDFLAGDLLHKHPGQGPLVWQSSLVPMIEKKHYDALLAENQKLKSENAVLREAVEFYGEEMNYSVDDYYGVSGEMRKRCVLYNDCEERNDVYSYAGQRAREALAKVGK